MTLDQLRQMTHVYTRDTNSYVFPDDYIDMFLNQAIDYIRQYAMFRDIPHLRDGEDVPELIPEFYHYILALFAASRCFDVDERFYEGVEKRNEFEATFDSMLAEIHAGNLTIYDKDGNVVEDPSVYVGQVKNVYFDGGDYTDDKTILQDSISSR